TIPVPHLSIEHHAFLHLCACGGQVPLVKRQLSQEALGCGDPLLEAHLSRECETFFHKGTDARLVSLGIKERLGQLRERVSDASLVSESSMYCQALLVQSTRSGVLTLAASHKSQGEERVGGILLVVHLPKERQR